MSAPDFEKLIKDAADAPGVDAFDVRIAKAAYAAGAAAEREASQAFALDAVTEFAVAVKQTLSIDMAKIVDRLVVRASGVAVQRIERARGEDKTNG